MAIELFCDDTSVRLTDHRTAWQRVFGSLIFSIYAVFAGRVSWISWQHQEIPSAEVLPIWFLNYVLPPLAVLITIWAIFTAIRTASDGDAIWSFSPGRIDFSQTSLFGGRSRVWGEDGVTRVKAVTRRLDGPDLFRLDTSLKGGPHLETPWARAKSEVIALADRLAQMFPSAEMIGNDAED